MRVQFHVFTISFLSVDKSLKMYISILLLLLCLCQTLSFKQMNTRYLFKTAVNSEVTPAAGDDTSAPATKGFGAPLKKNPAQVEEPKDAGTLKYERDQKRGVPEYNIFMRPTNGTEETWVPVGSMTIPRDTSPVQAIYEVRPAVYVYVMLVRCVARSPLRADTSLPARQVEADLLKGTFKLYPKLKAFYDVRKEADKASTFEYGYVLKAFPDEPIQVMRYRHD